MNVSPRRGRGAQAVWDRRSQTGGFNSTTGVSSPEIRAGLRRAGTQKKVPYSRTPPPALVMTGATVCGVRLSGSAGRSLSLRTGHSGRGRPQRKPHDASR